jgi:hypothetical protein
LVVVSVTDVSAEDVTGLEKLKKLYQSTLGKPEAPSNHFGVLRR